MGDLFFMEIFCTANGRKSPKPETELWIEKLTCSRFFFSWNMVSTSPHPGANLKKSYSAGGLKKNKIPGDLVLGYENIIPGID